MSELSSTPPSPITVGQAVVLSATATDPDPGDSVSKVGFYEDDGDGVAEDGELLGTDFDGSDGWSIEWDTKSHATGQVTLLAVAEDTNRERSSPRSLAVTLNPVPVNHAPTVNTFTSSPVSPITVGQVVTLTATASDPDTGDAVNGVRFMQCLDSGGLELLGVGFHDGNGWSYQWDTAGHAAGNVDLLALAYDGSNMMSNPKLLSVVLQPYPAPDMRLLLLDSPTTGLTATTLPGQAEFHVLEDHTFYGEVWVRSNPGDPANIGGGTVDMSFDPAYGRIVVVEPVNANWTGGSDGEVDNTAGTLTDLTRVNVTPSAGDDEWVLFARVQFSGIAPVDEAAHAFGPYDLKVGLTRAELSISGGTHAAHNAGADGAQVYSAVYDVDDSGRILGGDFGIFSAAYRTTVGGTEPPYTTWADFDGSGKVLGGDFGMFSGVYRKYTYEVDFSQLPSRYRPAGWTSGWSVRTLAGASLAGEVQTVLSAPALVKATAQTWSAAWTGLAVQFRRGADPGYAPGSSLTTNSGKLSAVWSVASEGFVSSLGGRPGELSKGLGLSQEGERSLSDRRVGNIGVGRAEFSARQALRPNGLRGRYYGLGGMEQVLDILEMPDFKGIVVS